MNASGTPQNLDPEELFAGFLEAYHAGHASIEELCARHPEHADLFRRYWTRLIEAGEVGSGSESLAADGSHSGIRQLRSGIGPYKLLGELGRGGQGQVYLAEDSRLHRRVAVKVLSGLEPLSEHQLSRFLREAEVASRLEHPGVCSVFDTGTENGVPYIVMRYVEGETLATKLTKARAAETRGATGSAITLPESTRDEPGERPKDASNTTRAAGRANVMQVVRLIESCARALHAAHEAGVIHRDIKPGNIMVTPESDPVILDFGLARLAETDVPSLTLTGEVFGTPSYMPPEQIAADAAQLDRRADVYSLGVTLYECLTLHRPFESPTREGLYQAIRTRVAPDPRGYNHSIPRDLCVVVATALEKNRDRRYQTALHLAEELRRVRVSEPILAKPAGPILRLSRWAQRNPALTAASAGLVLALTAGLVVSLQFFFRERDAKEQLNAKAAEATRNLADWRRMADVRLFRDLGLEYERDLWPASPAKVPAMERWLARVDELISRLPAHRATLDALRTRALPESEAAPASRVAVPEGRPSQTRRTWEFLDPEDAYQHDVFAELVAKLEMFEGPKGIREEVAARHARGATLRKRSIDDHGASWDACGKRTAASPKYGSLALLPQMGLIPLGPDPDSTFEEFAVADSGEIPVRDPATRKLVLTDGFAVVLVLLPGGTVGMGAQAADMSEPNFDPDARAHEGPVRDVTLPAFFISKYEMTRAQWLSVNLADPSIFLTGTAPVRQAITPRNPVENASWTENARTATRLGLRLPTEVEWEYACRAGTMTVFFTGDAVDTLKGYANVADEGSEPFYARGFPFVPGFDDGHAIHAPVGSFLPNAFGLHDMHGNVTEWMEDACKEPDAQSPTMDPRLGAPRPMRSIRGGAFGDHFTKLRVANRSCHVPTFRSGSVGLRVARNVDS